MGSILWSQNNSSTGVSRFVIDGVLSSYESREDQDSAYSFLSSEARKIKSNGDNLRFHIYSKGVFIEGHFNEKDEAGRQIAFMFFHPDNNIDVAVEKLFSYSSLIGCSVDSSIKNKIEKELLLNKKRIITSSIIVTIILLVISVLLLLLIFLNQ